MLHLTSCSPFPRSGSSFPKSSDPGSISSSHTDLDSHTRCNKIKLPLWSCLNVLTFSVRLRNTLVKVVKLFSKFSKSLSICGVSVPNPWRLVAAKSIRSLQALIFTTQETVLGEMSHKENFIVISNRDEILSPSNTEMLPVSFSPDIFFSCGGTTEFL